jgi:hypothetical protein
VVSSDAVVEFGQGSAHLIAGGYRRFMGLPGIRRNVRWAALPGLVLVLAACTSNAGSPGRPAATHATLGRPVTERFAGHRFTVTFTAQALEKAGAAGVNLPRVVGRALAHINALLPGPATTITVTTITGSGLIPQTGTFGETSPGTGRIAIGFGRTPQASFSIIMKLWLPRTLSHEVDHSVRILAGPGCGPTLLEGIVCEGISSAFDMSAFPGTPNPWDRAISRTQECALWNKAQPLLGNYDLYDAWMFGQPGIPHWTGFTIGYDIVTGYRRHHPGMSWSAITLASAATILAGSHYQPCSS